MYLYVGKLTTVVKQLHSRKACAVLDNHQCSDVFVVCIEVTQIRIKVQTVYK